MNFWSSLCLIKNYCTVWFVYSISISKWIYFILKCLQIKFNTFLFMWALEFLKSNFLELIINFQSFWLLFLESWTDPILNPKYIFILLIKLWLIYYRFRNVFWLFWHWFYVNSNFLELIIIFESYLIHGFYAGTIWNKCFVYLLN